MEAGPQGVGVGLEPGQMPLKGGRQCSGAQETEFLPPAPARPRTPSRPGPGSRVFYRQSDSLGNWRSDFPVWSPQSKAQDPGLAANKPSNLCSLSSHLSHVRIPSGLLSIAQPSAHTRLHGAEGPGPICLPPPHP